MSRPRWGNHLAGWLADLAALGLAWSAAIVGYLCLQAGSYAVFGTLFVLIGLPFASAFWLPLRLAPRAIRLADKVRREELALTLIRPGEYLFPRLKWVFVRAVAPLITSVVFLVVSFAIKAGVEAGILLLLLGYLVWSAIGLCLATLGTFDLLVRLCVSQSRSDVSHFLIPLTWAAIAVAAPGGALLLGGFFLSEAIPLGEEAAWIVMLAVGLGLFGAAVVFTVKRWRRACASYYYFG